MGHLLVFTRTAFLIGLLNLWVGSRTGFGVEITPPNPVPLHSLVRVVTSDENADIWILHVKDGQFQFVEFDYRRDGGVVFTGDRGSYAIMGKDSHGRFQEVVIIGEPLPPPPPGPEPDPIPPPEPTPEDEYATRVSRLAHKLVPASQLSRAPGIARVYRDVADRIGDELVLPKDIRDATKTATVSLLGADTAAWTPFFEELAILLYAWNEQEQRDGDEYRALWRSIADGLDGAS